MYFIYKIANQINGKVYIGSSTEKRGLEFRWYEHKQNARLENRQGYNYPLYRAIRKYGENNFTYEIIEENILTLCEREAKELFYINKFNSYEDGYNQTLDTRCPLADPAIKEKLATKLYSININTGKEEYFDSVSDAAIECGTDRGSIHSCIKGDDRHWRVGERIFRRFENGEIIECEKTIKDRLEEYNYYNPVINGERHSFTEWCEIYGITRQAVYKRMKNGMSLVEAIITPKQKRGREKNNGK